MKIVRNLMLASLLLLSACQAGTQEEETAAVLVPQGATAMAVLPLFETENKVETVSGSDIVSAELVKENGEYDIIVAPVNLGAKLLEKGNSEYRLQAVLTWGNLYIVSGEEDGPLAAFGEKAVPGKILSLTIPDEQVSFYNSVQDVQAQLLSGNAKRGMLAEPAATATIAKAKEQGISLHIEKDLQEAYKEVYPSDRDGYPQAAVFVKKGSEDKVQDVLKKIETFTNETAVEDPDVIADMIDKNDLAERIGIPSSAIAQKTWKNQHIQYVDAADVKEELKDFLQLFQIAFQEDMLVK